MDSIELNKIAAAGLCAALALGGSVLAAILLVPDRRPARPAFPIAGLEPDAAAPGPSINARLARASAAHGGQLAGELCSACHGFDKGGAAQVGPNLFGVAGRAVAAAADYEYSTALKQAGGRWTPARLDAWLTKPQGFAPGTKMGFAGINDGAARADVVAYLVSLSDKAPATPSPPTPAAAVLPSPAPAATTRTSSAAAAAAQTAATPAATSAAAASASPAPPSPAPTAASPTSPASPAAATPTTASLATAASASPAPSSPAPAAPVPSSPTPAAVSPTSPASPAPATSATTLETAAPPSPAPGSPTPASAAAAAPAPAAGGVEALVASADPKAGAATADAQCSACHSFDKGGSAMIGPALYGVFGRPIAKAPDYTYSAALSGHGGNWTVASLDDWLRNPRHFAPGTKMGFAGIADDTQRAAVIAYLRSLSNHP